MKIFISCYFSYKEHVFVMYSLYKKESNKNGFRFTGVRSKKEGLNRREKWLLKNKIMTHAGSKFLFVHLGIFRVLVVATFTSTVFRVHH